MAAISPKALLRQARQLATRERVTPKQASLRRAVSTAYYALFHLLVSASAKAIAPKRTGALPLLVARAFVHEEMAQACRTFAGGGAMPGIVATFYPALAVPPELQRVAQSFIDLQRARHDADYGTHKLWTRTEAIAEVERAEEAFENWEAVRPRANPTPAQAAALPAARLFLVWLVFQKKLQGR